MRAWPVLLAASLSAAACSPPQTFGVDGAATEAGMDAAETDSSGSCGRCSGAVFTPCNADGTPGAPEMCPAACVHGRGCVACNPGRSTCVGNEVHRCDENGEPGAEATQTCDLEAGMACRDGMCVSACLIAENTPSNVGCEFWAVDLDQQDALNDPASAPWGVALSNVGESPARVTIEINTARVGQPVSPMTVREVTVAPGGLEAITLPTRELDCGARPNDYASPGTCLSSNAYRIRSTAPIIVYQFNVFANAFSNDASLLLPASSLGQSYRVIGWPAGHPIRVFGNIVDRSYVTVVGVRTNTQVTVRPSWRIRGNPPVAATMPGGEIRVTLGPFDVLNLETDDGTLQDNPQTLADLSGTSVTASQPVAVFSGVESTSAPAGVVMPPTPPGWESGDSCCLDHLEEQLFPMESIGTRYVIPRSPVRSTGGFREADVLRFVGAAEPATVTTTLPPPFDSFTLMPGQVRTTWTQDNVTVTSDKPVIVGQILVSNQYTTQVVGDPSLTVFPPVDQFRSDYVMLTPSGWTQSWGVFVAEPSAEVTVDGAAPTRCVTEPAGEIEGVTYETRRCPLSAGVHRISGDRRFGVVLYGYGGAGSYALVGGADVRRIYEPPG